MLDKPSMQNIDILLKLIPIILGTSYQVDEIVGIAQLVERSTVIRRLRVRFSLLANYLLYYLCYIVL